MSNSPTKTFYDIHCHTMNLSHPCLYAFIRRYTHLIPLAGPAVGFWAQLKWIFEKKRIKNLLSIMERSVAEMLYAMDLESDPPVLVTRDGQKFDSMVITPLLMDFWSKDLHEEPLDYPFTPKSVVPQVLDVFNGIADFAYTLRGKRLDECKKQFPGIVEKFVTQVRPNAEKRLDLRKLLALNSITEDEKKNIEQEFGPQSREMKVFPFMGLNTTYCYLRGEEKMPHESTELNGLLEKYFGAPPQEGKRAAFEQAFGTFNGDITQLGRDSFIGIKVYPPLGFDPWPADSHENAKVCYLYEFCIEHSIPITAHCSYGGYCIVTDEEMVEYTHPRKWRQVLNLEKFSTLKFNLAHFGGAGAGFQYAAQDDFLKQLYYKLAKEGDPKWIEEISELIDTYENVYTDMGFSGVNELYYQALAYILDKHPHVEERLLFGTDFSINLTNIDNYQDYITKFLNTRHLTEEQKLKMCSKNPEQFLFG